MNSFDFLTTLDSADRLPRYQSELPILPSVEDAASPDEWMTFDLSSSPSTSESSLISTYSVDSPPSAYSPQDDFGVSSFEYMDSWIYGLVGNAVLDQSDASSLGCAEGSDVTVDFLQACSAELSFTETFGSLYLASSPPSSPATPETPFMHEGSGPMSSPFLSTSPEASSSSNSSEIDSELDAEGDTDSEYEPGAWSDFDASSDDDYIPTSVKKSTKTCTPKLSSSPRSSTSSASSRASRRYSPYSPSPSCRSDSLSPTLPSDATPAELRSVSSRTLQVDADEATLLSSVVEEDGAWPCTVCEYVPKRRADLVRHIVLHASPTASNVPMEAQHACWGVRVEEAAQYGVTDTSEAKMFNGELRVGGCWKKFSRRDAMLRHVNNKKCTCIVEASLKKSRRARNSI